MIKGTKEEQLNYMREYRKTDKCKEKQNEKFVCEVCGGKYQYKHKNQHLKTNKHLKKIA